MTAPLEPVTAVAMKTLRERAEDYANRQEWLTKENWEQIVEAYVEGFYDCADREDSNATE